MSDIYEKKDTVAGDIYADWKAHDSDSLRQAINRPNKMLNNLQNTTQGSSDVTSNISDVANKTYDVARKDTNALTEGILRTQILNGDSVQNIEATNRQLQLQEQLSVIEKLAYAGTYASENVSLSKPNTSINNNAVKLANKTTDLGNKWALSVVLEKIGNDAEDSAVSGIAAAFIPGVSTVQGIGLENTVRKRVPNLPRGQTRSEDIDALRKYLVSLGDESEQAKQIYAIYNELSSGFGSKWQAAQFVQDLVEPSTELARSVNDIIERAGQAADVVGMGQFAKAKLANKLRKSTSGRNMAAEGGRKDVVADDAINTIKTNDSALNTNKAIAIDDTLSSGIDKVMPKGVSTHASSAQDKLIADTEKLLKDLEDTTKAQNVKTGEIADAINSVKQTFNPAINKTVASVDFVPADTNKVVGELYRKPADAVNFTTKEAAEAWGKRNVEGTFEVVADTANVTLVNNKAAIDALKADKLRIEAELSKEAPKKPRKAAKAVEPTVAIPTPTVSDKLPKELAGAKPRYAFGSNQFSLTFQDDFDKAAYISAQKTKSKADQKYIDWASSVSGKSETEIRAHGQEIKIFLKEQAKVVDNVDAGTIVVPPRRVFTSPTGEGMSIATGNKNVEWMFNDTSMRVRRADNVAITSNVPMEVDMFANRMGELLGLKNNRLAVMDVADINNIDKATAQYVKGIKGANGAFFISDDGVPTIAMFIKRGNTPRELAKYVETFAHEYGHFFEHTFQKQYSGQLQKLFNDYLGTKGIPKLTKVTDWEDLLDMRSNGPASSLTLVGKQYNWNVKNYLKDNPHMEKWLKSHQEWFAENFAKWSLTNDIPTSMLGEAFKAITDGVKKIVEYIRRSYPDYKGLSSESVAEFMQTHINAIKVHSKQPISAIIKNTEDLLLSPATKVSKREKLSDELSAIDEKIADMERADDGIVGGYLVRHTLEKDIDYTALKGFTAEDIDSIATVAIDPKLGTSSQLYENMVVGVHREARIRKLLSEFVKGDFTKLSKAERKRVVSVLTEGDAISTEFTEVELIGKHMSKNEIAAYQKFRTARNVMHMLRDGEASKSLRNRGYKNITVSFAVGDGETLLPIHGFAKKVNLADFRGKQVYDTNTQTFRVVSDDYISKNPEMQVFEYFDSLDVEKGRHTKRVLAHPSYVKESRIQTVIPYRQGEFSRIYDDQYFIKVKHSVNVDEIAEVEQYAYKTARSRREAQEYVKAFNTAVDLHKAGKLDLSTASKLMEQFDESASEFIRKLDNGEFGDNPSAIDNYNRSEDDYLRDYTRFAQGTEGFTKSRGQRLGKVDKGDRSNTLGALESLQAEITNTARVSHITEWRDTSIIRWHNEFYDTLTPEIQKLSPVEAFFAASERGKYIGLDKRQLFAQRTENYIKDQLGLRTKEEQLYEGFTRKFTEWAEQRFPKLEVIGAKLRNADTLGLLRTINFHSMLGALNPVQLLTQAQGMVNAISIHPVYGLVAAKNTPFIRMALMSDNEEVWKNFGKLAKATSAGFEKTEDFVETVRAIRKSGLIDGIRSTSLYNIEDGRFNIFSKTSSISEASAFFFNRGEEFARITSFDVARREFIRDNPGIAWWTDEGLNKIIARQDDLTSNMTKANTAFFQKGFLSIPAQFLQYNLKLGANLLTAMTGNSKAFTRKEAFSIMFGHLALYGMANNGFPDAVEEMIGSGMESLELSREQRLYLTEGLIAGLINSGSLMTTGERTEIAFGERFNTFDFYKEFVKDMVTGKKSALELVLGPTSNTFARIQGFREIGMLWMHDPDIGIDTLQDTMYMLGVSSVSTLSNLDKALIAHNNHNFIMSKAKEPIAKASNGEIYFQAIGIPPAEVADFYRMTESRQEHKKSLDRIVVTYKNMQLKTMESLKAGDKESAEKYIGILNSLTRGMSVEDYNYIFEQSRLDFTDSAVHKLLTDNMLNNFQGRKALVTNNKPTEVK